MSDPVTGVPAANAPEPRPAPRIPRPPVAVRRPGPASDSGDASTVVPVAQPVERVVLRVGIRRRRARSAAEVAGAAAAASRRRDRRRPCPSGRPTERARRAEPAAGPQAPDRRHPAGAGAGRVGRRADDGGQEEAPPRRPGQGLRRWRRRPAPAARARPQMTSLDDELSTPIELDEETLERRRGQERKGRPVGRYLMVVHVRARTPPRSPCSRAGRSSSTTCPARPTTPRQIDGNIYLGRVQNVLPGMEAAFVDIGTPKNAVLYRGDVQYDADDVESAPKAQQAADRAAAQAGPDDPLPGHQEPDRHQGRPPHPGGVAARAGSSC